MMTRDVHVVSVALVKSGRHEVVWSKRFKFPPSAA